ncbi:MAG: NTP transferase domain-containing protein [Elusimicrobia bacterium]|nr:NTP transferase domain-containing protein [Elusimicrobiota bacterium]
MARRSYRAGERWTIILAGGEGRRLSDLTIRRFGEHRPKQYCAFLGERSMFEHTMGRAVALVGRQRVVTVIGRGHLRYIQDPRRVMGYVVEQPRNCDTAPGVFLPLSYVLAHDNEATVTILPSDHFISPNWLFARWMDRAAGLAERLNDRLILAAAVADRPETEYGWIQPGRLIEGAEGAAHEVLHFHEKPDVELAAQFLESGFLWNTLNMAVKARTLWSLGWEYHPGMMRRFESLKGAIGGPREAQALAGIYEEMETVNFSKGVLEHATPQTAVIAMQGLEWSDWGKPERIQETLDRRLSTQPARAELRAPAAPAVRA